MQATLALTRKLLCLGKFDFGIVSCWKKEKPLVSLKEDCPVELWFLTVHFEKVNKTTVLEFFFISRIHHLNTHEDQFRQYEDDNNTVCCPSHSAALLLS